LRRETDAIGRDHGELEITVGGARTVADAERLARLGVHRLVIALRGKETPELEDEVAAFGTEVIEPTRDL
jgi:phosphoribosylformimino-5-aminoimidazole carboxamide ribonucleotide (ProFAR) isomerase